MCKRPGYGFARNSFHEFVRLELRLLPTLESLSTSSFLHDGGLIAARRLDRDWRSWRELARIFCFKLFFHDGHERRKRAKIKLQACDVNNENVFI